jgi:hypothetical protein
MPHPLAQSELSLGGVTRPRVAEYPRPGRSHPLREVPKGGVRTALAHSSMRKVSFNTSVVSAKTRGRSRGSSRNVT